MLPEFPCLQKIKAAKRSMIFTTNNVKSNTKALIRLVIKWFSYTNRKKLGCFKLLFNIKSYPMNVSLQNFRKWTIQNRLRLLKADVKKQNNTVSHEWKHILFICKKPLKAYSNTALYNNLNICEAFVDIHIFLPKFSIVLNLSSCFFKNGSLFLLQYMWHDTLLKSLFKPLWLVAGPKTEWQQPTFKFNLKLTR